MYVVTIVRCIQTENFPLREIRTWEKVRYNGGYVVNGVRYNATGLYKHQFLSMTISSHTTLIRDCPGHVMMSQQWSRDVLTVVT